MDTQQKIIEAAIRIFNEDLSAPLDAVAATAGISRRSLHRHFSNREALLAACYNHMLSVWQSAAIRACRQTPDPLEQLSSLLYAAIDCGTKFAFLTKCQQMSDGKAPVGRHDATYKETTDHLFSSIGILQGQGVIHPELPLSWIKALFSSMVITTIAAADSGDIAPNKIKQLAWYSFKQSIGITNQS